MKVVNNECELRLSYFLKCRSTDTFLLGKRGIKGMRLTSFCMIGHECTYVHSEENFLKPIAFDEPYWWQIMAAFSGVELSPGFLNSISGKASHGSVINTSTDELGL